MATSIFKGSTNTFGGAIRLAGGIKFTIGGVSYSGVNDGKRSRLAVQQMQVQANRACSQFYDLCSDDVYYVIGRCQSQATLSRIIGPAGDMFDTYERLTDVCKIASQNASFTFNGEMCDDKGKDVNVGTKTLYIKAPAIASIALSMTTQDFTITDQMQIQGAALEYDNNNRQNAVGLSQVVVV